MLAQRLKSHFVKDRRVKQHQLHDCGDHVDRDKNGESNSVSMTQLQSIVIDDGVCVPVGSSNQEYLNGGIGSGPACGGPPDSKRFLQIKRA